MSGVLFVVATPIGNLEDVSQRARSVLESADIIACEDTRHSRRLLDAHGIDRPLLPLHQHNERGAAQALLQRLQEGATVALVSDAGTPLVSDPGAVLTRLAHGRASASRPFPVRAASSRRCRRAGCLPTVSSSRVLSRRRRANGSGFSPNLSTRRRRRCFLKRRTASRNR